MFTKKNVEMTQKCFFFLNISKSQQKNIFSWKIVKVLENLVRLSTTSTFLFVDLTFTFFAKVLS